MRSGHGQRLNNLAFRDPSSSISGRRSWTGAQKARHRVDRDALTASEGRGAAEERAETRGELNARNRTGTGSAHVKGHHSVHSGPR